MFWKNYIFVLENELNEMIYEQRYSSYSRVQIIGNTKPSAKYEVAH